MSKAGNISRQGQGERREERLAAISPPTRRPAWLAGAALAVLTLLAHAPAIPGEFLWDDDYWLGNNPIAKAGQGPWGYWSTTKTSDYLPVTSTFFYAQRQLWGDRPAHDPSLPYPAMPYRAVNVALHATAAVLVWRVLTALSLPGAWLGAALFAVHPVTAATTGWVAETKNTLSMVFGALSLLAYLRFEAAGRWRLYAASVAALVLALLTKQSAVVLPAVLMVLLWWRRRPLRTPRAIVSLAGLFLLAAAAAAVTVWYQSHYAIRDVDVQGPQGLLQRLATAAKALWFYAFTMLAPARLSLIYPRWEPARLDWTIAPIPALLAWAAALAVCRGRPWARPAAAATACFVLALAPVLGLVDMSFMLYSFVSDHLAYLALPVPMAVAAAVAARLMRRGPRWRPVVMAAAAGAVIVLGTLTAVRAHTFASAGRLWADTARKNPAAWVAHAQLADTHFRAGRGPQAIGHFQAALAIAPQSPELHNQLATVLYHLGDYPAASAQYAEAVRLDGPNGTYRYWLGLTLIQLGRPAEAAEQLERAAALRPNWSEPHLRLGLLLADMGQGARAAEHYRRAMALEPASAAPVHMLAWLLATTDEGDLHDGAEALRLAERAGSLANGDPVWLPLALSAAYAEAGRAAQAVAAGEKARAATQDAGQRAEIQSLIEYYRRGQTYRDFKHSRP